MPCRPGLPCQQGEIGRLRRVFGSLVGFIRRFEWGQRTNTLRLETSATEKTARAERRGRILLFVLFGFRAAGENPTRAARQKTLVAVCHTPHGKRRLLTCGFHPFGRRRTVLPARVLSESRVNRSRALLRASSTVTLPTVYKFI